MLPDVVVLRHRDSGAAHEAALTVDCAVINAGDGMNEHPTQALLDALTLRRRFGRLEGLKVAICGDVLHNCAAHSNIILLEKMGAKVSCVGPRGLLPQNAPGATEDLREGLEGADAVMVLRLQKERFTQMPAFTDAEYFASYGLTAEKLACANPGAIVMHPGPMNRGVEIDAALADDPERSLITTQVEMGVAVRMACLDLITRNHRK
jgi:aspartate carbamoyltransferase catalytic subunit